MKIENAKELFFENKEHYLQFRQSWKNYINSGKAKPVEQIYTYSGELFTASKLTCKHHLIYKLLQGKDTEQMFSPTYKVQGRTPFYAFYEARDRICLTMRLRVKTPSGNKHYDDMYRDLIEPFGETLTEEMLLQLVEKIKDWALPI
jgi:hypothetical protein